MRAPRRPRGHCSVGRVSSASGAVAMRRIGDTSRATPPDADEHQSFAPFGVLVRELRRHAATERMAHDGGPIEPEHLEQVAHAVGICRNRVVGPRLGRGAVAQQVGHDDRVALGERRHERHPPFRAVADAVQQEERRPVAHHPVRPLVPVDPAVSERRALALAWCGGSGVVRGGAVGGLLRHARHPFPPLWSVVDPRTGDAGREAVVVNTVLPNPCCQTRDVAKPVLPNPCREPNRLGTGREAMGGSSDAQTGPLR